MQDLTRGHGRYEEAQGLTMETQQVGSNSRLDKGT